MVTKRLLLYIEAVAEELVTADHHYLQDMDKIVEHVTSVHMLDCHIDCDENYYMFALQFAKNCIKHNGVYA